MLRFVFLVLWLAAALRLFAYVRWARAKGCRRGTAGAAVLSLVTLIVLILEEFRVWR